MSVLHDGAGEHDDNSSGMSLDERPDSTHIRLWGEVDLDVRRSAGPFCQTAAERGLPVVVESADVTFMDSTGMSILVRMARDAEAGGYPLELHNPPWILRELLGITGVDQLLTLVVDAEGDGVGDGDAVEDSGPGRQN